MTILQYADGFSPKGRIPPSPTSFSCLASSSAAGTSAVTNHRPDGSSETIPAEWHFAWALGGRAIQDVWIAPSRAEGVSGRDGEWGATLRFYDDSIDAWRSTWIGPRNRIVMPFLARSVGDEIVLEGSFEDGVRTRWIFSEITPDVFSWRAVDSRDDGESWRLLKEMKARRRACKTAHRAIPIAQDPEHT
jgi:hypothetical protein